MRYAAGKLAYDLHLLGLEQLFFSPRTFGNVLNDIDYPRPVISILRGYDHSSPDDGF